MVGLAIFLVGWALVEHDLRQQAKRDREARESARIVAGNTAR